MPLVERAAYHEAGHLVMAREQRIRIDAIKMPQAGAQMHASRFASLNELCDLASGNDREKRIAIQTYIRFLLAGPVAVLLRLDEHHGIAAAPESRTRFRANWLARTLARSDADIDLVYSLLMGWGRASPNKDLDQEFQRHWEFAVAAYEYPILWSRVKRVASRLISYAPTL